jgi:phenylalanine-4-hydroxylase
MEKITIKGGLNLPSEGKAVIDYFLSLGATNPLRYTGYGFGWYYITRDGQIAWSYQQPEGYREYSLLGEEWTDNKTKLKDGNFLMDEFAEQLDVKYSETMGTPLAPQSEYEKVFKMLLEKNSGELLEDVCYLYKKDFVTEMPVIENVAIPHWKLVPVWGKIDEDRFFNMLANGCFPVNIQLRDESVLDYCVLRDFFHDFFGHVPFLFSAEYSDVLKLFGIAYRNTKNENVKRALVRLYWATIEFGLIKTENGLQVLGAGLVSSKQEMDEALQNTKNTQMEFDLVEIAGWDFDAYGTQDRHYIVESFSQVRGAIVKLMGICG